MQKSRKVIEVIHGEPHVSIGKRGITEGIINEVKRRLDDEGIVKVRLLKSATAKYGGRDVKTIANEIAMLVGAKVIDVRGRSFVLIKMSK